MSPKLNGNQNWLELAGQANRPVTALAKRYGVSGETLRQHFIKYLEKPRSAWLAEQRQHQAIELLRNGSSVKEPV